jgi:hypothetical protein
MPKPRKTVLTGLKHLGTILWHPQQYYRYKRYRGQFVAQNHLDMHDHYDGERQEPVHPYPDAPPGANNNPANARQWGVIYPGDDHHHTILPAQQRLSQLAPFDHQAHRGVDAAHLGADRSNLVVLRNEAAADQAPQPILRVAKKRAAHNDLAHNDVGRTQHSTLTGGERAAAAALFIEPDHQNPHGQVLMSSGHYQPDEHAAVKLAIQGKRTGTVLRRETDFRMPGEQHNDPDQLMDLSLKRRMKVVSDWAKNRN